MIWGEKCCRFQNKRATYEDPALYHFAPSLPAYTKSKSHCVITLAGPRGLGVVSYASIIATSCVWSHMVDWLRKDENGEWKIAERFLGAAAVNTRLDPPAV